uniref:Protein kinase domain-containing protein n=1 Tax=Spongospora subterranea TaxID=70186 RepID=A0A0H5QKV2_9EUKA|eukprot:CRZ02638.1 hypothetical protein [Spongospora subterranea]
MGPPWIITEDVARSCFTQIAAAVNHLHSHMLICHRDIKPSNMLIHLVNGHPQVLLSDFGVAQSFADTPMFTDIMGTYPFIPPEACSGEPYDGRAADIWALGVTLYSIVFGKLPFYHQNLLQLFQLIENCDLDFPLLSRDHPVLDLLANILLNKNPHKRQMDKILSHPWLQS